MNFSGSDSFITACAQGECFSNTSGSKPPAKKEKLISDCRMDAPGAVFYVHLFIFIYVCLSGWLVGCLYLFVFLLIFIWVYGLFICYACLHNCLFVFIFCFLVLPRTRLVRLLVLFWISIKWEQFETCSYSKTMGKMLQKRGIQKRDTSGISKSKVKATEPVLCFIRKFYLIICSVCLCCLFEYLFAWFGFVFFFVLFCCMYLYVCLAACWLIGICLLVVFVFICLLGWSIARNLLLILLGFIINILLHF